MPRTSKKAQEAAEKETVKQETVEQETTEQAIVKQEAAEKETVKQEVSQQVDELMRLYPQYEQLYVTKDGFVHPFGSPKYLVEGATLYKNKYHKQ